MNSAHTPGPWAVSGTDTVGTYVGGRYEYTCVAMVGPERRAAEGEREANARLIAAAPDLLDALERLVANLDEGDFISATRIEGARAAIGKAR